MRLTIQSEIPPGAEVLGLEMAVGDDLGGREAVLLALGRVGGVEAER